MNRFVKSAPPLLITESREEFDADAKASEQTRVAENTMSPTTHDAELELIFRPALLRSESATEYEKLRSEIYKERTPTTRIERDLVDDYVEAAWECRRLRRLGPAIINGGFLAALQNVLAPTSKMMGIDTNCLALEWFKNEKKKQEILERLAKFGWDEDAIEAEAFRMRLSCVQAHSALLSSAENRKRKALGAIDDYRAAIARPIQASSSTLENRLIEHESS